MLEDEAKNLILDYADKLQSKQAEIFMKWGQSHINSEFFNELLEEMQRLTKFAQDKSYSLGYHEGCEDTEFDFAERS